MDSTSAIPAYAGGVLHQVAPPSTGAQKCDRCGGWIMGILSYVDEGKRYCPACWAAREKEKEGRDGELRQGCAHTWTRSV